MLFANSTKGAGHRVAFATFSLILSGAVIAQEPSGDSSLDQLRGVSVTATPFDEAASESITPVSAIGGEELARQPRTTLGEALQNSPGVSNSNFGPGVGRPVIRGLGGSRVKTLNNGLDSFDAAAVSPDHAVTSDLQQAEAVEVLRGPATLLYGSGAIGGVVNVVSDDIPQYADPGLHGRVELGTDSASSANRQAVRLHGGGESWAVQFSLSQRDADDLDIPGRGDLDDEDSPVGYLENSAREDRNVSIGTSAVGDWGHVGVSFERVSSRYGIPGGHGHGHHEEEGHHDEDHDDEEHHDDEDHHEDEDHHDEDEHHDDEHGHGEEGEEGVAIDLQQRRLRIGGEWLLSAGAIESLRWSLLSSDYEHTEFEGSTVGTVFNIDSRAARVELKHRSVAGFTGVVGAQVERNELAAVGEEAFIPAAETNSAAVFVVERRKFGSLTLEGGLRFERVRNEALGQESRSDSPVSVSLGLRKVFDNGYSLTLSSGLGERAPAVEELFSNGFHPATNSFEVGDPDLDTERSAYIDLGFTVRKPRWKLQVNLFSNRFSDYIFAASQDCNNDGVADRVETDFTPGTCDPVDEDEDPLHLVYQQQDANFRGGELSLSLPLIGRFDQPRRQTWLTLGLWGDMVRGELDNGGNLPRQPVDRIGVRLDGGWNKWGAGLSLTRGFEQDRLAELETPTDAWTRLDSYLEYATGYGGGRLSVRLSGRNLLDEDIRHHVSFLKDSAPEAGRSFQLSLRFAF